MFEAFISFKNLDPNTKQQTRDSQIAQELYNQLTAAGISTFYSNVEVQRSHDARWGKLIDDALQEAKVIIVVGTKLDYIKSEWVEYEWRYFSEQIRTGKNKQMITVLEGLSPAALPPAFTQVQSYSPKEMDKTVDKVLWILGKQKQAKEKEQASVPATAAAYAKPSAPKAQPTATAAVTPKPQSTPPTKPVVMRQPNNRGKFVVIAAAVLVVVLGLALIPILRGNDDTAVEIKHYTEVETLSVGDRFYFGSYEQDNDLTNGAEPIEWRVLEVRDDGNALVISEYALQYMDSGFTNTDYSWMHSPIRIWLNNELFTEAFSDDEKGHIINSRPVLGAEDKLFCLSVDEAKRLFENDNNRICRITRYAGDGESGNCSWWLRSSGTHAYYSMAYVYSSGKISESGLEGPSVAVRPALYIDLDLNQ